MVAVTFLLFASMREFYGILNQKWMKMQRTTLLFFSSCVFVDLILLCFVGVGTRATSARLKFCNII